MNRCSVRCRSILWLLTLSALPVLLTCSTTGAAEKPSSPAQSSASASTLDNLQAAYNGESNAHVRYLAFAKKADEEGYAAVANLFRATARAEEIHAGNHAEVIKAMGATPKAKIEQPEVKSTAENLKAAIAGESYERDKMYPEFIAKAKADGNTKAIRTFTYARAVEAGHAKLYKEALDNLPAWKVDNRDFYVCTVCGNTVTKIDFKKCPVCHNPKEKYVQVS